MSERLDNLLPLHAHLSKHQLAGWDAPPPAQQGLGVHLLADVMIPMPDGVRLAADVYVPEQPGRYPVILSFSSYNYDLDATAAPTGTNEVGSPSVFVPRGYVQIIVAARGVGRSEGELQRWFSAPLVENLEQCIAWAAQQSWSDGQVAMHGASYYGMVQPLVAVRRPPALKAFFASELCTAFPRHVFRYGGQPNIDFVSLWAGANFTNAALHRHVPPVVRSAMSWLFANKHVWPIMQRHIDALQEGFKTHRDIHPTVVRWMRDLIAGEGDFPEGPTADLANIEVPFVVVQNRALVSLHQFGAYDLFEHARSRQRWLIVGEAEYELPVRTFELEALAFFDHVLKGANNGYAQQARVRYFRDGSNDWGRASTFPPAGSTTLNLYPSADGLADAPTAGTASWLAIPQGAKILPEVREGHERIAFAWTAPRELELFGPLTLSLELSSNEIDTLVAVRLDRVTAAGARQPLGFGLQRASVRTEVPGSLAEVAHDPDSRVPLVPFQPTVLRFSLTPGAAVLAAGDRLELAVASNPERVRARASEGYIFTDSPVPFFAKNTIHFGPSTYLAITVVTAEARS